MVEEMEGRVQEVERSVETLESQLRAQIARTQAGTRAVLVIGIIVIAIIFAYMTWLTTKFKDVADPVGLAEILELKVSNEVPAAMQKLEETLTSQAAEHVAALREQVVGQIPVLREKAEELAGSALDSFADRLDEEVDDIVGEVIEMKRVELDPLIAAASVEGNAEKIAAAFEEGMEVLVGQKLDEVLLNFERSMIILDMRLDRLSRPIAQLTPEEMLEKEAIQTILVFIDDAVKTGEIDPAKLLEKVLPST